MAGRARPRLRELHRRFLTWIARDITVAATSRSALVLAPHPDDETIGCGGTILRKTDAGAHVVVVIAADGEDLVRRAEATEACRRLGVPREQVRFLAFPDGDLSAHVGEVRDSLRAVIQETRPDDIYIPSPIDNHPDHRTLAAAVDMVEPATLAGCKVYAYPVWFWNRWAWADRAAPHWRQRLQLVWRPLRFTLSTRVVKVDISSVVARKRAALDAHASQVGGPGSDPSRQVLDPKWLATFFLDDEVFFQHRQRRNRRER